MEKSSRISTSEVVVVVVVVVITGRRHVFIKLSQTKMVKALLKEGAVSVAAGKLGEPALVYNIAAAARPPCNSDDSPMAPSLRLSKIAVPLSLDRAEP
jgi:hypothetical protein